MFCDLQRYTRTASFISQSIPITRLDQIHSLKNHGCAFVKFIVENNDSQAYVEESLESNAVAKFFKHENVFRNGIPNSQ